MKNEHLANWMMPYGFTPLELQQKSHPDGVSGWLCSWSRRELNPGPMTVPSVFYVRSLLARWLSVCPRLCRRRLAAGIVTAKVPEAPCDAMLQASLLMTLSISPETWESERSGCSLVNSGAKLRQRERTQCG